MSEPRVLGAWRYPVKSMQGETLAEAEIGPGGIPGDRAFAVRDRARGRALSGRRAPALLMARARWLDGVAEITLPDGSVLRSDAPGVHAALSGWLGLPVDLAPEGAGAPSQVDLPIPEELAEIYGTGHATEVVFSTGSSLKDVAPLHFMPVSELAGEDVRRFRPNFLVDGPAPADGAEFRLGGAVLRRTKATVRCVMPTRPQPGLEAAPGLLRELVRRSRAELGFYAEVVAPGSVEVSLPSTA